MNTILRQWPWPVGFAGIALLAISITAMASARDPAAQSEQTDPSPAARPELVKLEDEIRELGQKRKFQEALFTTEKGLARSDLNSTESAALRVIKGRLLRSLKRPDERIFQEVLGGPCGSPARARAYQELASLRHEAGDYQGAIGILRELIESCVDDADRVGTNIMDVETNYRHYAAMDISYLYEKLGEANLTHRWAVTAKEDYPFASFCGNAISEAHEHIEDRLEHTARLADVSYTREDFDWGRWGQRRFGPSLVETSAGLLAGTLLLALSLTVFASRHSWPRPWRLTQLRQFGSLKK